VSCKLSLLQVVAAVSGKAISTVENKFEGVGTDTRKDLNSQVFVALKGENFDGHSFLEAAAKQGAFALLVHDENVVSEELKAKVTVILVEDTLLALQNLAKYWRRKIKAKVVAISGSTSKKTNMRSTHRGHYNYIWLGNKCQNF